ncbi:MAG: glycogen debranching protein GlgX [Chloroflexi bacterium]|nr:glycogen debranching protein GlgX [Chloroflexota bacterium]MCC6893906.1 glycogen debranching protein GlgX [Anaerolineae bacterium]
MKNDLFPGQAFPLGATVYPTGINFCVFSKNCETVELLLFDHPTAPTPSRVIHLHPITNHTFYYWHIFIRGLKAGQVYGYRVYGETRLQDGLRFDGSKVLVDPYARAVITDCYDRQAACQPGDNCAQAMRSVVVDPHAYNWQGDQPLHVPFAHSLIYEMHVAGFTHHPNSGVEAARRGTFAGLIEKIPYLKALGVTAVELLPVQQFDAQDAPWPESNYWGYSPVALFAPHRAYASRRDPLGPVDEFRDMVKALHKANIEVILDVVFNHTAEGNQDGPMLSLRGFENRAYYILEQDDKSHYANFTGCGNTLNANQSIVRRMIMDCLRYWVTEMHVDGFRFDLASVLARDEWGQPLRSPPILWEIESEPMLAGTKIIAEAWDAAGLYQVGSFIGDRWAEWNGKFRDDVRRFLKGDRQTVKDLAARLTASRDVFAQVQRDPNRSINFITCHDGFTLNDVVSYNDKHNEANGQQNQDGTDQNHSWNCGIEGVTTDPRIATLRTQQIKNLITILLVSQGTPMLLMGDEVRRTQNGNNNAYCQNNDLSWFNWEQLNHEDTLLRFMRGLIRFTQESGLFREHEFWRGTPNPISPYVTWHGTHIGQPDWGDDSHSLAFSLHHPRTGDHLHVILNAYWEALRFELPPLPAGMGWWRILDTALAAPDDFCDPAAAPRVKGSSYQVEARSSVLLLAQSDN